MNGNVMPLVGISDIDEAMFTKACKPNPATRPARRQQHEMVALLQQTQHGAHHDAGEDQDDEGTEEQAEFLTRHRENEIRPRIRQILLHLPLARPAPEHPAIAERGERGQRLIGGVLGRVEEQHHAGMHMADEQERGDEGDHHRNRRQPDPFQSIPSR